MGLNNIEIEGISVWSQFIESFLDPDEEGIRGDHFAVGTLRIWHRDGWSPGFFTNEEEGFWVFHVDYQEQEQR